MPKALERKLKAEAKKKGLSKERADAYVYGTLRKTGENKMPTVGEAYDKKHGKKTKMETKRKEGPLKKYFEEKRGGKKSFSDTDMPKGSSSFKGAKYMYRGAKRLRWDPKKKTWVPAPE